MSRSHKETGRTAAGLLAWGLMSLVALGCRDRDAEQKLVRARQAVVDGLEAWKRGDKAEVLKANAIEFHEENWDRSARLIEYEIVKAYSESDGSPRCAVRLVVQYDTTAPTEVLVTYEIVQKNSHTVIGPDPFS